MAYMHISEVEDKSAGNLSRDGVLKHDSYHDAIFDAAQALYFYGSDLDNFLAVCTYCGQWSSGKTLWMHPDGGTVAVDTDGGLDIAGIAIPNYAPPPR